MHHSDGVYVFTQEVTKLFINSLNREGVTFVIVQHDIPLIMRLCKRCIVLDNGKVIADGPTSDIQQDKKVIEAYLGE